MTTTPDTALWSTETALARIEMRPAIYVGSFVCEVIAFQLDLPFLITW